MDIPEAVARGVVLIVMIYLIWFAIKLAALALRRLRSGVASAPEVAGRIVGKTERAATKAADAFRRGREG